MSEQFWEQNTNLISEKFVKTNQYLRIELIKKRVCSAKKWKHKSNQNCFGKKIPLCQDFNRFLSFLESKTDNGKRKK